MLLQKTEIDAMLTATAEQRFDYSIKRILEQEKLYLLEDGDHWLCTTDKHKLQYLIIYPDQVFAKQALKQFPTATGIDEINLIHFLHQAIPVVDEENIRICIFPQKGKFVTLTAKEFIETIDQCAKKWHNKDHKLSTVFA